MLLLIPFIKLYLQDILFYSNTSYVAINPKDEIDALEYAEFKYIVCCY